MNNIKEPIARKGKYDFVVQQQGNKIKYSFLLESNHYYVTFAHLGPDWKVDYEVYNEHNQKGTDEITYGQQSQFIQIFAKILNHFLGNKKPNILFFNQDESGEKNIYDLFFDKVNFKNYTKKQLSYGGYAIKRLKPTITEGLKIDDLEHLIKNVISVNEYNSKLSKDKNIVVAFYVRDEQPARDLCRFIEKTDLPIVDADYSPAPDINGDYLVFLEFKNDQNFFETFDKILNEVNQLCNNNWRIKLYKKDQIFDYTLDNLKKYFNLSTSNT